VHAIVPVGIKIWFRRSNTASIYA